MPSYARSNKKLFCTTHGPDNGQDIGKINQIQLKFSGAHLAPLSLIHCNYLISEKEGETNSERDRDGERDRKAERKDRERETETRRKTETKKGQTYAQRKKGKEKC